MRVTLVVAVILMAITGVGAFMGWSQQDTQGNAQAAQTAVQALWAAISRGDVEAAVGCIRFPVTIVEVSGADEGGMVSALTEDALRRDLAELPQNSAAGWVSLLDANVELIGRQMACVFYRLPANTPPLVGPEGPSDRLVTVVVRDEKGAWKVIATAVPR